VAAERQSDGGAKPEGGRAARCARALALSLVVSLFAAAMLCSSAFGAEAPVITGVSPEQAAIGYGPLGEGSGFREVAISGENLAEATVGEPIAAEPYERQYEVKEDTGSSLVAMVRIAGEPGIQELVVRTPGGEAVTHIVYEPKPGPYPAIGSCAPVAPRTGGYHDAKCTKPEAAGKGKYEWTAGIAGETVALSAGAWEFAGSKALTCSGASGTGTLKALSEVVAAMTFEGCALEGVGSCSNTALAGELETEPLLIDFAWQATGTSAVKKTAVVVLSRALNGALARFTCGGKQVTLEGTQLAPLKASKSAGSLPVVFAVGGKRQPKLVGVKWVEWGEDTEPSMRVPAEPAASGRAPFVGTLTISAPEPFAVNPAL
jgi:hypothetical protein